MSLLLILIPGRKERYQKKFEAGRKHIHDLFRGMKLPEKIDQQAVFLFGSKTRETVGGGKVLLVSDISEDIKKSLIKKKIEKEIVLETFPLLRILHIFIYNI